MKKQSEQDDDKVLFEYKRKILIFRFLRQNQYEVIDPYSKKARAQFKRKQFQ